jgi:sigma-B regulation protein RsbU (phosphoserine phosphatase)
MDSENKTAYKVSISFKSGAALFILGFLIIITSCVIGYLRYTAVIELMYNDKAYEIGNTVLEEIDTDKVIEYTERIREAIRDGSTEQVSSEIMSEPEYGQILDSLSKIRTTMNANYAYIADQTDLNGDVVTTLTYLFDADNPNDSYPPFVPGDTSEMNPSFLSDSKQIYSTGERSDNYFYSHSAFGYNTTAIIPIKDESGKVRAILGIELAMQTLNDARMQYIVFVSVAGVCATILFVFLSLIYVRKKIVDPIKTIKQENAAFVGSQNETVLSDKLANIKTGDEIEEVAHSIYKMQNDIIGYICNITKITAEKERIGAELNVATQIQADMLPSIFPAFPERKEFDIYATMTPAKEVGGDFYDFFLIDDDHIAMVMADVSGKGVPAALFMVIAKTLIKNHAQLGEFSPAKVLMSANDQLCEGNEAELFVTVWLGILEISTGKGKAANAGHEHPTIRRKDGKYELVVYRHSPAVATMEGIRFKEHDFELHPGDSLFVYTDGVAEATNAENELFGTDRMLEALNRDPGAMPKKILETVKSSVDEFVGAAPQFDDITMLGFKYFGPEG